MGDVKKFVIERDRWLRGDEENSRLLRPSDGKMCCLGFYGLACGLSEERILDVGEPCELSRAFPDWLVENVPNDWNARYPDEPELLTHNTGAASSLMSDNDSTEIDDSERERRITETFAFHGVEVEFR